MANKQSTELYNILLNPQLAGLNSPAGKVLSLSFDKTGDTISDVFSIAEEQVEPYKESIIKQTISLFLAGEREILLWDEVAKLSEMDFLASCLPLKRPLVDFCCGYGYWISKLLKK